MDGSPRKGAGWANILVIVLALIFGALFVMHAVHDYRAGEGISGATFFFGFLCLIPLAWKFFPRRKRTP